MKRKQISKIDWYHRMVDEIVRKWPKESKGYSLEKRKGLERIIRKLVDYYYPAPTCISTNKSLGKLE